MQIRSLLYSTAHTISAEEHGDGEYYSYDGKIISLNVNAKLLYGGCKIVNAERLTEGEIAVPLFSFIC